MSGSGKKIDARDLKGLRDLRAMSELLKSCHDAGTHRDKAGNRNLHMDEYCLLVLMWLYNPVIDSLRGLQQASELNKVQKRLGVGRASLGSLSESVTIFEPERLEALAEELSAKLPVRTPEQFAMVNKKITAVDGSVFRLLTQIASLAWLPKGGGKSSCGFRLHAQFEVFRGVPHRIDVTSANPRGEADERKVMERTVDAGHCYLMDRGYEKYVLWNAIHQAKSDYVCRIRDNPVYEVVSERELTDDDRSVEILSDQIIRCWGRWRRSCCDGFLRIVTNHLDVPAKIIAALYELRWTVELYFRIIKQLLGCRHLLSTKPEGVTIQIYLAIIACIMILSITGKMPTKRTYEMICFYLLGWASLQELERHIEKLKAKDS